MNKVLSLVTIVSLALVSRVGVAQEGKAATAASVKSTCVVGSLRPVGLLLREQIRSQYAAAGHKNVFVSIGAKAGRTQSQAITYSNIQGLSGVTVAADGSTVAVGTNSTPISLRCSVELPVTIKVSYVPSTGTERKTITATQKMVFDGFFR